MVLRSMEATIEKDGTVRLHKKVRLSTSRRAILIILDEPTPIAETALLSEPALADDWNRPDEDDVWSTPQSGK